MARPLDDRRRASILAAATQVFADHGLAASTALVSKTAKISEGSFFTYFKTKDELVAALYVEIRREVAGAVMTGFPVRAGLRARLEHVFLQFVTWGAEHRPARKALAHLNLSKAVTPRLRAQTQGFFAEVDRLERDARAQRRLHLPPLMGGAAIKALGDMTMELIEAHPDQAPTLKAAGFQMLWGALSSKPVHPLARPRGSS
jgi:AcrR family transcriptional regulator